MRRANKHQSQTISFTGLVGGVNISMAPEQIDATELQEAQNFIYARDSKRLTGRNGLGTLYTLPGNENIRDMWYDVDTNVLLYFTNQYKAYRYVVGQAPVYIGDLEGSDIPMCGKFMDKIWIASGGKLQYYDYTQNGQLTVVPDSPTCNIVFQRFSRIAVSMNGTDGFYLSGVGDGTDWSEDTNRTDKEQWLDVGYGDSGDIAAIVPLATDIVFIKSNGKIYQLTGDAEPTDWQVTEIANNTDIAGTRCAVNIGSSVIFLSIRGLKTLSAVMEYGNIQSADIGDKFNGLLTDGMYEPQFYHLQRHNMILIRPTSDHRYYVAYNYLLGSATTIRFAVPVDAICETASMILAAGNGKIYAWDSQYLDDDGLKIDYILKPKAVIGAEQILLKGVDTKFTADYAGKAEIIDGSLDVDIPTASRNKFRCNHSTDCLDITVKSNDRFTVDHINLEVAEL